MRNSSISSTTASESPAYTAWSMPFSSTYLAPGICEAIHSDAAIVDRVVAAAVQHKSGHVDGREDRADVDVQKHHEDLLEHRRRRGIALEAGERLPAAGSSAMLGAMISMAAPSNMYGAISSEDSIRASAGVAQG